MPVDASIYQNLQAPDILGAVQQGISMRQMLDKQKLEKQQLAKQQAVDDAYKAGVVQNPDGTTSFDRKKTMSELTKVGGKEFLGAQQQFAEIDKNEAEANQKKHLFQVDMISRVAPTITDQASYSKGLETLAQQGVDVSKMPQAYDKSLVDRYATMALSYKDKMDAQFRDRELKVKERDANLKAKELDNKNGGLEGWKAADKDYAKDYNDFTSSGQTKALESIAKLEEYKKKLEEESKSLFKAGGGPISGSLPDAFRTEKSISLRDNIINTANSGLKATFGGSGLTDSERKSAASEFYNDKLGPAENIDIIDRKIGELKNSLNVQSAKASHFRKYGTLKGLDNSMYDGPGSEQTQQAASSAIKHPEANSALLWAQNNPKDPKAAEILKRLGK